MHFKIRDADLADATAISDVLQELIAAGKRDTSGDEAFVRSHYLEHPHRLRCYVAVEENGNILGFQSLKIASPNNSYDTPIGWGIIGTHVRPSAGRLGVGSRLFVATLECARTAKLPAIEAYISDLNSPALAYYEALGFKTYAGSEDIIRKAYCISETEVRT